MFKTHQTQEECIDFGFAPSSEQVLCCDWAKYNESYPLTPLVCVKTFNPDIREQ